MTGPHVTTTTLKNTIYYWGFFSDLRHLPDYFPITMLIIKNVFPSTHLGRSARSKGKAESHRSVELETHQAPHKTHALLVMST